MELLTTLLKNLCLPPSEEDLYLDPDDPYTMEKVTIPSTIAGTLIGERGATVKQIEAETGASVWIDWDRSGAKHAGISCCIVSGPTSCVAAARE